MGREREKRKVRSGRRGLCHPASSPKSVSAGGNRNTLSYWLFFLLIHQVGAVSGLDGLAVLAMCGLFLLHHADHVFAVDERLEATDNRHLVQRKHVLGLDCGRAVVVVFLQHYHLHTSSRLLNTSDNDVLLQALLSSSDQCIAVLMSTTTTTT